MKPNIYLFICLQLVLIIFSNGSNASSKSIDDDPLLKKIIKEFKKEDVKSWDVRDFSKLQKELEDYINKYPDNQEAHYYLGYIYDHKAMPDGSKILETDIAMETIASKEFEKVISINPDYNGDYYIQSPYSKISSIWSTVAIKYIGQNKLDSAVWAFKKGRELGGFSNPVLDNAKNVFSSCEKNAILFVVGDMETFPFWYLQVVEEFRRDVTVVNLSLLNTPWYAIQIKEKDFFSNNNIEVNLSNKEIEDMMPIFWEDKIFTIPVSENTIAEYSITDKTIINSHSMNWTMPPSIKSGSVEGIRAQDIYLREIILKNEWKRPMYFINGLQDEDFIGLKEHLQFSGLILKLTPQKSEGTESYMDTDGMNIVLLEKNNYGKDIYRTGIKWEGIQDISNSFDRDLMKTADYYREVYISYIYYLTERKNPLWKSVLSRIETMLPLDNNVPGYLSYTIIKFYYENLGLKNEFEKITENIKKAVENKIDNKEFYYNNFNAFITLSKIYKDSKEYKKAKEVLQKIEPYYENKEQIKYFTDDIIKAEKMK